MQSTEQERDASIAAALRRVSASANELADAFRAMFQPAILDVVRRLVGQIVAEDRRRFWIRDNKRKLRGHRRKAR